jgi:hypothetical protein
LKWHHPVGLLHDLFSGGSPSQAFVQKDKDSPPEEVSDALPWRLVLHFSDWPDDQLVRLDLEGNVLHDAYINSVKEADFLRNGSAKAIMSLSKDDSTQLWTAVQNSELNATAVGAFTDALRRRVHTVQCHLSKAPFLASPAHTTAGIFTVFAECFPTYLTPSPGHSILGHSTAP